MYWSAPLRTLQFCDLSLQHCFFKKNLLHLALESRYDTAL
jgi:hypothetical protein